MNMYPSAVSDAMALRGRMGRIADARKKADDASVHTDVAAAMTAAGNRGSSRPPQTSSNAAEVSASALAAARTKSRGRIRGVGAAERQRGYAWSGLNPKQREAYGNQANFQEGVTNAAATELQATERQRQRDLREEGRREVLNQSPPPQHQVEASPAPPPASNLDGILKRRHYASL